MPIPVTETSTHISNTILNRPYLPSQVSPISSDEEIISSINNKANESGIDKTTSPDNTVSLPMIRERLANAFDVPVEKITNTFTNRFQLYDGPKTNENQCFEVYYYPGDKLMVIESLKYPYQNDCKEKGYVILNKLKQVANDSGINLEISIDASTRILKDPTQTKINYATLNVLTKGQTYYNEQDFVSEYHQKEVLHNDKVRNTKMQDIFDEYGRMGTSKWVMNQLVKDNPNITVKEVGEIIKELLKKPKLTKEEGIFIQQVTEYFDSRPRILKFMKSHLRYVPNGRSLYGTYLNNI